MAFPSPDSGIYVLGDECGSLHLCSATYSDQAIETLRVHQGAVLRARFNPIASDILLTCSADWSLGLSRVQASGSVKLLAQLKVNSQRAAVRDVVWSPENASVRPHCIILQQLINEYYSNVIFAGVCNSDC